MKRKQYYRALKSVDVSADDKKIQNILKEVFQNLAMKVVVAPEPIEDSDVADFIEELRKIPNLHFEKWESEIKGACCSRTDVDTKPS